MTAQRDLIIVDVETSGLRSGFDIPVEVAWLDTSTGESSCFVPVHDSDWVLTYGDPRALEINGYRERLRNAPQDRDEEEFQNLAHRLRGNTMGGSNPTFDWDMLRGRYGHRIQRHHRLADLAAYAAGALGTPVTNLEGLEAVSTKLKVFNEAPHTAMGDVTATARCFEVLVAMRAALDSDLHVVVEDLHVVEDPRVPRGVAYVVPPGYPLPFGEGQ